jgi:ankyrin repeat domain-containing protein 50
MDPFSLATGVAGLISLAGQIGSSVMTFQRSVRGARQACAKLMEELASISTVLSMLQLKINGNTINARLSEQLREPVAKCNGTLEALRIELDTGSMSIRRRLKWATSDEKRVMDFVTILERYKSLFNLALQADTS